MDLDSPEHGFFAFVVGAVKIILRLDLHLLNYQSKKFQLHLRLLSKFSYPGKARC